MIMTDSSDLIVGRSRMAFGIHARQALMPTARRAHDFAASIDMNIEAFV
jgi:hypothetical protein